MGVPTFYKWLSIRFPLVVKDAIEINKNINTPNVDIEEDVKPNGHFDNLYLDMNGIVHPCTHPEEGESPKDEEEMLQSIFEYVDRIFNIVMPQKLLYLALDGVAPRAKMNQQRSRRFKAARLLTIEENCYAELKEAYESANRTVPPRIEKWDSNVITPGTPFMARLSDALRHYIRHRQSTQKSWKRIQVIFSDSNKPGEGEHKIMEFIRSQRNFEYYDHNTKHVLHGADADLIMLGLATHECHFSILREVVQDKRKMACTICGKEGHTSDRCHALDGGAESQQVAQQSIRKPHWKDLQFLQLSALRNYLSQQIDRERQAAASLEFNFERYIDDFVFLCFFCGNDFLPHLPSLSIHKGSIDLMMEIYKMRYPIMKTYLTEEGSINFDETIQFVEALGNLEESILIEEVNQKVMAKQREAKRQEEVLAVQKMEASDKKAREFKRDPGAANTEEEKKKLMMKDIKDFYNDLKERVEAANQMKDPVDNIQLGVGDPTQWRHKYYMEKFHLAMNDDVNEFSRKVAANYLKGMCWVLAYYYQGCPSWSWFYPFHHAPLAVDLSKGILDMNLQEDAPLTPFQQLLAVLPPQSSHCIPPSLVHLMKEEDGPIVDFYPKSFKEDCDGKRFRWQWVALLPFVDIKRLKIAMHGLQDTLAEEEKLRNTAGQDLLFNSTDSRLAKTVLNIQKTAERGGDRVLMDDRGEAMGYISPAPPSFVVQPMEMHAWKFDDKKPFASQSICCVFEIVKSYHRSVLLEDAIPPQGVSVQCGDEGSASRRGFNAPAVRRILAFYTRNNELTNSRIRVPPNPAVTQDRPYKRMRTEENKHQMHHQPYEAYHHQRSGMQQMETYGDSSQGVWYQQRYRGPMMGRNTSMNDNRNMHTNRGDGVSPNRPRPVRILQRNQNNRDAYNFK